MPRSLTKCWEENYKPRSNPDQEVSPDKDGDTDLFFEQMGKRKKIDKRDELQIYLAEKVVRPDTLKNTGSVNWWKASCQKTNSKVFI